MDIAEVRQAVDQLVRDWYDTRLEGSAKQNISVDGEVLCQTVNTAKTYIDELNGKLVNSPGVDDHKVAAAICFAICHHRKGLFKFKLPSSPYSADIWKENCYVDCALTTYLSLLAVDRNRIESEEKTFSALRDLVAFTGDYHAIHKNNLTVILFLSTMGFLLERSYPDAPISTHAVI